MATRLTGKEGEMLIIANGMVTNKDSKLLGEDNGIFMVRDHAPNSLSDGRTIVSFKGRNVDICIREPGGKEVKIGSVNPGPNIGEFRTDLSWVYVKDPKTGLVVRRQ